RRPLFKFQLGSQVLSRITMERVAHRNFHGRTHEQPAIAREQDFLCVHGDPSDYFHRRAVICPIGRAEQAVGVQIGSNNQFATISCAKERMERCVHYKVHEARGSHLSHLTDSSRRWWVRWFGSAMPATEGVNRS